MPVKGLRKLVDIAETSTRLHGILEAFLDRHNIAFKVEDRYADGIRRYLVASRDLCCAQSVLPALQDIAEGKQ